ncbi:MAG: hypothetical protein SH818_12705 [Saprospiraceae bacterium]|nr:hypothetical protein [Saprospiraceae bacterium]
MRWPGLSITICWLICLESDAQIRYTHDFTSKLRAATLGLSLPDSTWYNVVLPCEDKYNQYDLCLIAEVDSAELRYIILDDRATRKIVFPEMHYMARLSNLATNDEAHWMRSRTMSSRMVYDSLKADWAGEMSFTPKPTLTDKKNGKLFSIYKENTGMVFVLLYYNHEFPGFNDHLHSVYFNLPKPKTNN